jgi:hypothetical protein
VTSPDTLHTLAARVSRLSPDRRDPERWHIEKDDIARKLLQLARSLEKSRG